jgi:transposase-like protein
VGKQPAGATAKSHGAGGLLTHSGGHYAGKTQRRVVSAWIGTAFAQDDAETARKQRRQVADQLRPRVSKLAALMDNAAADVLAYLGFPTQHRAKIHSTNPLERLNGEIKRRSDVVGIFPTKRLLFDSTVPCCSNRTMSGTCNAHAT